MRGKRYRRGDRVKIYIHPSVSPEMIAWMNKQSDLTSFFFYGAQQLHKQVGEIDVSKILPSSHVFSLYVEKAPLLKIEVDPLKKLIPLQKESTGILEKKVWHAIHEIDCPYF